MRVLELLELQLEHGLKQSLESARDAVRREAWVADAIEAFSSFIQARADAETIEQQVLENFARVTRSLRQAAYAHLTEFPPPSLFFGLEQAKIAERVDSLAHGYHAELLTLASSLGAKPRLAMSSTLAVSYEYIGSSNHCHTEYLHGDDRLELHTQISVPLWLLYTPRYLPTICHELAHPIAAELLADHGPLGSALVKFRPLATQLIEQHFGRGGLRSIPNIVPAIARELLTDVLSVRAAGPSYAVAWHASTLGRGALSPRQSLSLPTCVRLRILARVTDATLTGSLAEVLDADTHLYRAILERRRYVEKASFQEALHDVCAAFVDELTRAIPPAVQSSPPEWASDIQDIFAGIRRIPRFRDTPVPPSEDLGALWSGGLLRSVPGLLWQTHLDTASATLDTSVPEGRVFHALHTQRMSRWVEGDYSEWLWIKRMMSRPRTEFHAWWLDQTRDSRPLVADVIGAYNFLSVRQRFNARSFKDYPPVAGDHHFHAARQILVELRRRDAPFDDVLAEVFHTSPLLVIEIHIPPSIGQDPEAFLDLATAERPGLHTIAAFKALGTGDYVLVMHVRDMSVVPGALADFKRNAPEIRTLTNVLLPPGVTASPEAREASGPPTSVRAFLRFHREPPTDWAAALGTEVERVLGADDAELSIPVASAADLEKVLTIADIVASSSALATFDARTGFVVTP